MVVDDPSTGVHLYRLAENERELVKSFHVPVKKVRRIRQVALADSNQAIVSGSDHGVVYVRDRRSGELLTKLCVHPDEWIQTVAASVLWVIGIGSLIIGGGYWRCSHHLRGQVARYGQRQRYHCLSTDEEHASLGGTTRRGMQVSALVRNCGSGCGGFVR